MKKLNQIRQQYTKQIRKNNLNKTFIQNRKLIKQQNNKADQQEFKKIYPLINSQNYQQYLYFLIKFSYHPNYNYQLVIFASYLYNHLLSGKQTQIKQTLELLQTLTQFEQIEFPQTEEIVDLFLQFLKLHTNTILNIIANLLQHHQYSTSLKQYLLEKQFINNTIKIIETTSDDESKRYLNESLTQILCSIISTHPLIPYNIFQQILQKIIFYFKHLELKELILDSFWKLLSTVQTNDPRIALIYHHFSQIFNKEYYNHEEPIVNILYFSIKSNVQIDKVFYPLLANSLTSPKPTVHERVVQISEFMVKQLQQDKILSNQELNFYSELLKNGLRSKETKIVNSTVDLLLLIMNLIEQQNRSEMISIFESYGIFEDATNIQMQHQQLHEKIELILLLQKKGQQ